MILLLALALSMVIALLQGGKLVRLAHVPFRCGWLAILAFTMQTGVIYFPEQQAAGGISWKTLIIPVTYTIILIVTLWNIKLPGMVLIVLGLASNILVMAINGGYMPVTLEALRGAGLAHMALGVEDGARVMASKDIILSRGATRLWFLSDVLVLGRPFPWTSVFSVGDVLLASGVLVLLRRTMCSAATPERENT
jgi:hypothetical protein